MEPYDLMSSSAEVKEPNFPAGSGGHATPCRKVADRGNTALIDHSPAHGRGAGVRIGTHGNTQSPYSAHQSYCLS